MSTKGLPHQNLPQPTVFHIRSAEHPQGIFIDRRGTNVRDHYPTSGFKNTKTFEDRSKLASGYGSAHMSPASIHTRSPTPSSDASRKVVSLALPD